MTASGLALGLIALAIVLAIVLGSVLEFVSLLFLMLGLIAVIVFGIAGLLLSAIGLFRSRRRSVSIKVPLSALAVNMVAVGAVVAAVAVFMALRAEPTFNEATEELTGKGLTVRTIGGGRPALLALPSGYDSQRPLPLVLSLHGYTSHYMAQDSYFGLSALVNSRNFALILPNGTKDDNGDRYWNATDFCCGITDNKPDDAAYLAGLVDEAGLHANIGPVFVAGMSNGASMAYRLVCENLPGLTAIVAMAGSFYSDPNRCASASPVSILHIHGTHDDIIKIGGGSNPSIGEGSYPAVNELVQRWAGRAGCDLSGAETLPGLDIDKGADGDETEVTRFSRECRDGLVVEYWEMDSSPHAPRLAPDFGRRILDWLFDSFG